MLSRIVCPKRLFRQLTTTLIVVYGSLASATDSFAATEAASQGELCDAVLQLCISSV